MKKNTIFFIITTLIVIISYLSMSLILTKSELKSAYKVKNNSIDLIKLSSLANQIENYRDTISYLRLQLSSNFPWFRFNSVSTITLNDDIIITGDTLKVKVGLMLLNTPNGEEFEFTESKLILFKDIDSNGNRINPYDTIITKDWEGLINIKTEGIGVDSIIGLYYMPRIDNPSEYFPFAFDVKYLKIDSNNTDWKFRPY